MVSLWTNVLALPATACLRCRTGVLGIGQDRQHHGGDLGSLVPGQTTAGRTNRDVSPSSPVPMGPLVPHRNMDKKRGGRKHGGFAMGMAGASRVDHQSP
jgi:hypothetical protein